MAPGTDMQSKQSFGAQLFAPLIMRRDQLIDILIPFRHSAQSTRQRCSLIISRVQLISFIFAILIPLWCLVDYWLAPDHWDHLALFRIFAATIYLLLALPRNLPHNPSTAISLLALMLMIPPAVYLLTLPVMEHLSQAGMSGILRTFYGYVPYIVMAGLSIFPLTLLESLALSLPVFLAMTYGNLHLMGGHWEEQITTMWLLFVIMCISAFSATSQLQYMMALVKRAALDPLTGAFTRRTGTETVELQYRLATIQQRPFALAFLDLDDFKSVNDVWGHDQGDQLLSTVAERLRSVLRRGDTLIRWGGEEFLMVFSDTDRTGAELVVTRMMTQGYGNRPDGSVITVSIGVASSATDPSRDWTDLVDLADQRMYMAKRRGKNRAILDANTEIMGVDPKGRH